MSYGAKLQDLKYTIRGIATASFFSASLTLAKDPRPPVEFYSYMAL